MRTANDSSSGERATSAADQVLRKTERNVNRNVLLVPLWHHRVPFECLAKNNNP